MTYSGSYPTVARLVVRRRTVKCGRCRFRARRGSPVLLAVTIGVAATAFRYRVSGARFRFTMTRTSWAVFCQTTSATRCSASRSPSARVPPPGRVPARLPPALRQVSSDCGSRLQGSRSASVRDSTTFRWASARTAWADQLLSRPLGRAACASTRSVVGLAAAVRRSQVPEELAAIRPPP